MKYANFKRWFNKLLHLKKKVLDYFFMSSFIRLQWTSNMNCQYLLSLYFDMHLMILFSSLISIISALNWSNINLQELCWFHIWFSIHCKSIFCPWSIVFAGNDTLSEELQRMRFMSHVYMKGRMDANAAPWECFHP